ncbi:hypothetical protein D9M73_216340 [compost metagenome]
MKRTAVANSQAEGGDFRSVDIDTRGIGLGRRLNSIAGEQVDEGQLDTADQLTHAKAQPAHIQQQVGHQLPGAMVSDLAAAVGLHHRDVARHQQVLGLAGLPLGEDRRVLDQPDFILAVRAALLGKTTHGLQHRFIGLQAKLAKTEAGGHQSTIFTMPVARRALLIS